MSIPAAGMVRAFVSQTATRKIEFWTGIGPVWQFHCSCGYACPESERLAQICVALANHICYNSGNGRESALTKVGK